MIHQGQGAGLSNYGIGETLGAEDVSVTGNQMPGHPHAFSGTASAANTPTPSPAVVLAGTPSGFPIYDGTASPVALSGAAVSSTGGSIPHNNRQPYLAITYIIALEGIYPSRN
jgi:microcystin-dependent protein